MAYTLGTNVKVGQKILLDKWYKVIGIDSTGVLVKGKRVDFGSSINGWKAK